MYYLVVRMCCFAGVAHGSQIRSVWYTDNLHTLAWWNLSV